MLSETSRLHFQNLKAAQPLHGYPTAQSGSVPKPVIYHANLIQMNSEVLLKTLQAAPEAPNQTAMAKRLGYSLGKTNYILKAVIEKGLVKAERFASSENKLGYRYVLTPAGVQERIRLTEKFIERKQQEYEQLREELEQLRGL